VGRVDDGLGDADLDAADGVDHVLETLEVDHHVVVEADARELLELAHRARGPADRERLVPHHVAAAGDRVAVVVLAGGPVDHRVARDADPVGAGPVGRQVEQDRGVRALAHPGQVVDVAALAVAGVRAHHQDVERLLGARDALLVGAVGAELLGEVDDVEVAVEVPVDEDHRQAGDHPEDHQRDDEDLRDRVSLAALALPFGRGRLRLGAARISVGHASTSGLGTSSAQVEPTRNLQIVALTSPFRQTPGERPPTPGLACAA
jgi:hypothetical protein